MNTKPLKPRTYDLSFQYKTLVEVIKTLLDVEALLRSQNVDPNDTTIVTHMASESGEYLLQYDSEMTDEEIAGEEKSLARQKANRRLAYSILKEEFDTEKL